MATLNVRCCCKPRKLLGQLTLPDATPMRPSIVILPLHELKDAASGPEPEEGPQLVENVAVELKYVNSYDADNMRTKELAVYSDNRDVTFWRRFGAQFKEAPDMQSEHPLKADRKAELYFESHITIEPVFGTERERVTLMVQRFGFKLAKLIMRKEKSDLLTPHVDDTFMTAHGESLEDIQVRTAQCVATLRMEASVEVRRYKIEEAIIDSRFEDFMKLRVSPNT